VRISHAGLDPFAFRTEVAARIDKVVPHDTYWFPTVDPATLLVTGAVVRNIPEWAAPYFFENEFLRPDYNKFTDLVADPSHVNSLFEATGGDLVRSERYRGLLADLGLGDDLRMALIDGSACWGYLCFHRERTSVGFSADDTSFLKPLVRHLASGLRTALLRGGVPEGNPGEPGVLLIADDLSIVGVDAAAHRWLDELEGGWSTDEGLPDSVCAAVARLWAIERSDAPEVLPPPSARARTRAGRWLTFRVSRLSGGPPGGRMAVVMEPGGTVDIAPLIVEAYGLSVREREVAMLVLHGYSTKQISAQLHISENTVQDHMKAIFDKTGVRSRRDLVAQLSIRHYAPRDAFGSYSPRSRETFETHGAWYYDDTTPNDRIEPA